MQRHISIRNRRQSRGKLLRKSVLQNFLLFCIGISKKKWFRFTKILNRNFLGPCHMIDLVVFLSVSVKICNGWLICWVFLEVKFTYSIMYFDINYVEIAETIFASLPPYRAKKKNILRSYHSARERHITLINSERLSI